MTPKEKAKELIEKFTYFGDPADYTDPREIAIYHALIAVDEIIKDREKLFEHYWIDLKYWQEVKQEIEKL